MDQNVINYFNQRLAAIESALTTGGQDRLVLVQEEPRGPSQLIEIPVTRSGLQQVTVPDIQQLRSTTTRKIIIKSMRLISADFLTHAPVSGNVTAPDAELQKIVMNIYCEGWQKGQLMPILTLNDTNANGSGLAHRYHSTRFNNWQDVDWSKTILQYVNGTSSAIGDAAYSVLIDVEYIVLNSNNQEIVGPG